MAKKFLVPVTAQKVTGLSLPVNETDATNKLYVDNLVNPIYSAVVLPNNTAEIYREPISGVNSVLFIVDVIPPAGIDGESFHSFAKPLTGTVGYTVSNYIGNNAFIQLDYYIDGSDIIGVITNTNAINTVTVDMRKI